MKIGEKIYNYILYRRYVKKTAALLLRSSLLLKNPFYNFFYEQTLNKKMKRFGKIPFRMMIENTNICNADCVFCPHKKMKRKKGVMTMDLFKKTIDQSKNLGINYITIYGFGEPLLDKYFFERVRYAKEREIERVTTNTNGMYLDKRKIFQIFISGLDEIYISFDAASENVYKKIRPGLNFQTVEKNILHLIGEKRKRKAKKPEIILSYVETEDNKKETKDYLQKWKNQADRISISSVHNWTGAINSGDKLKKGRREPCRLLWTDMVISWNGDVPLCCHDYENKIILGNIEQQSIKEIWGGEKLRKIRKWHKKNSFEKILLCKNCQYNYHHKSPWWVAK